jgi:hydroxyacylglutathione hydrolase
MFYFKKVLEEPNVQVVDLRGAAEFKSGHIKNADHVFVGTLLKNLDKVSKDKKVVIHCQGGDRATIGYSLLAREGYNNVLNYWQPHISLSINLSDCDTFRKQTY